MSDPEMKARHCSERACPFPPVPGETLCAHHVEMFAFDFSLEDDAIEVDYTRDPDEPRKARVSVVSAAEDRIARWKRKKERAEDKRLFQRLRARNRRIALVEAGRCPHCKKPIESGKKICADCLAKCAALYHYRRDNHQCITCCRPTRGAASRCPRCRERRVRRRIKNGNSAKVRKLRAERINAKLCVQCGKLPITRSRYLCGTCFLRISAYEVQRRAKLKALGLCRQCKRKTENGHILCERCLEKRKIRRARNKELLQMKRASMARRSVGGTACQG